MQLSGIDGSSIGSNVTILEYCRLVIYREITKTSILIGDGSYVGFGFTALSASNSTIKIGNDVLFASSVMITNKNHGVDPSYQFLIWSKS